MSENKDPLDFFLNQLIIGSSKEEQIEESLLLFVDILIENNCIQPNRVRIPYHAITQFIYNYTNQINLDDIVLSLDAREMWLEKNISTLDSNDINKIRECFHKFRDHIVLAVIQKKHIQLAAMDAKEMAVTARRISNLAGEAAEKANRSSENAEKLAKKAEYLANEADAQAKSTIANYISILGIFASIIFTLFGGVNLIGATVKLLEANSRWPYLTFIIALLMICLLTLLNMMIKWITSMSNLQGALDRFKISGVNNVDAPAGQNFWQKYIGFGFYTRAILALSIVLGISMLGMYKVKKENAFSYSTETTTNKNPSKKASKSLNDETTVVSKFTLSNNVKEPKEDKKED